jgi:hypothetical protein
MRISALLVLMFSNILYSQNLKKITKLDSDLNEISGLCFLNDSVLIAHNDGGNNAELFFLNLKGKIIHSILVENANNVDWEDITKDNEGNVYIGDVGNNLNKRNNLAIYKIKTDSILFKKTILAQKVSFTFEDQFDFPPALKDLHFDVEAICFYDQKLFLFTKSRTKPFNGISNVYTLDLNEKDKKAIKIATIQLKSRKMIYDGVTGVVNQGGFFYLLTYSGIEILSFKQGKFEKIKRISFLKLTQKEAIEISNEYIYLADEKKGKLLKNKFYRIKLN